MDIQRWHEALPGLMIHYIVEKQRIRTDNQEINQKRLNATCSLIRERIDIYSTDIWTPMILPASDNDSRAIGHKSIKGIEDSGNPDTKWNVKTMAILIAYQLNGGNPLCLTLESSE